MSDETVQALIGLIPQLLWIFMATVVLVAIAPARRRSGGETQGCSLMAW